jgi:hypothetical protein
MFRHPELSRYMVLAFRHDGRVGGDGAPFGVGDDVKKSAGLAGMAGSSFPWSFSLLSSMRPCGNRSVFKRPIPAGRRG